MRESIMTTGTSNRNSGGGGSGGKTNGITNKTTAKNARNCNAALLNIFTMENTAAYASNAFYIEVLSNLKSQKSFRSSKFLHRSLIKAASRHPFTVFLIEFESKSGGFYKRQTLLAKGKQKQRQQQQQKQRPIMFHSENHDKSYLHLLEYVTDLWTQWK